MTPVRGSLSAYEEVLCSLIKGGGALTALLITRQGNMLASAGETSYLNTTAMAALVAGMFAATREVARIVGEPQFSILLQQGEKRHIHISLIRMRWPPSWGWKGSPRRAGKLPPLSSTPGTERTGSRLPQVHP